MIPSNTICVSQEGPANALALNKDASQVVIAGRNVFKVFAIGETEFTEVCNLRVGKNLNLNFSSIDVAWNSIEENTIATAATNGAVVVWNLGRSGRSKQEHVFSDHKRTVNKVSFHLTDPALLISGSQDGTMKCFDLRMKEVARTFISNTESIRDVQFSPHQAHTFAAVSENGSVQLWDVRRSERCVVQFTAHSGPVFACDWHPTAPALATASRDKTIKVWDIHGKPTLEHTIYTIASVGHVKWRPHRKHHVASCALVLDCAVHVWDVRRPHVPLATFAEHRDVATAVAWLPTLDAFLSTSRDCSLYRHRFNEAAHPVLWANPQGVSISARGELASAVPEAPLPPLPTAPLPDERHLPGLGRKQPRAGSLTAAAQATLERAFPSGAASVLRRARAPAAPLVACAALYRTHGARPHELATHNARVARAHDRHMVGHVWDVVRCVYSSRAAEARRAPAPPPPQPPPPQPPQAREPYSAVEEEPMEEVEEWAENQFHNSGVLGLPTHSIYVPPSRLLRRDDETAGWVSAASAHYVDVDAANWTLPEEAFPLRAPAHAVTPPPADDHAGTMAGGASPGGSTSTGSGPAAEHPYSHQTSVPQLEDTSTSGSGSEGELSVRAEAPVSRLDAAPLLAAALRAHAALGDVQTAATVCLALQDHRSDLFPYIDEALQEQWLLGYIELLHRYKLWNVATEVIRCAWLGSVRALSQQSTSIAVCCGRCARRTRPHQPCDRCHARGKARSAPDLCAVCHQVVRGLYAWCQGCAHGGHLAHMRRWMETHRLCPAGCGHQCQLG
ncbi:GATOR2 complex protein WDR24 [Cydia splendana]|uniref:GATOR2 complex protein WDR24 n=1 Tax=Cydia splendana TaxID=1100963 RepID=UPI0028F49BF4